MTVAAASQGKNVAAHGSRRPGAEKGTLSWPAPAALPRGHRPRHAGVPGRRGTGHPHPGYVSWLSQPFRSLSVTAEKRIVTSPADHRARAQSRLRHLCPTTCLKRVSYPTYPAGNIFLAGRRDSKPAAGKCPVSVNPDEPPDRTRFSGAGTTFS